MVWIFEIWDSICDKELTFTKYRPLSDWYKSLIAKFHLILTSIISYLFHSVFNLATSQYKSGPILQPLLSQVHPIMELPSWLTLRHPPLAITEIRCIQHYPLISAASVKVLIRNTLLNRDNPVSMVHWTSPVLKRQEFSIWVTLSCLIWKWYVFSSASDR